MDHRHDAKQQQQQQQQQQLNWNAEYIRNLVAIINRLFRKATLNLTYQSNRATRFMSVLCKCHRPDLAQRACIQSNTAAKFIWPHVFLNSQAPWVPTDATP
jgi:hypothetical protein